MLNDSIQRCNVTAPWRSTRALDIAWHAAGQAVLESLVNHAVSESAGDQPTLLGLLVHTLCTDKYSVEVYET